MEYNVLTRPKLPRNKFGEVEDKHAAGGGSSYFTSTANNGGNGGSSTDDIPVFVGSTSTLNGKKGLVPAPKTNNDEPLITNDNQKFLKGNGAWVDIPISRYTAENANKDGINLTGNLSVSDTLTTQTLNVLGTAHFWELVIDKVKAAGGNLLITPANFTVDFVGADVDYPVSSSTSPYNLMFYDETNGTGIYGLQELFNTASITSLKTKRLYMINSDSSNQIVSEFEIGDMVRCKTLNLDENSGFTNKDYWTFVLATGTETYNSKSCMYIDVFYQFTAGGSTYGLGTKINQSGVVSGNRSGLRAAQSGTPNSHVIAEERLITGEDIPSGTSEVYIGTTTTIPSGTTLSADIITSDGTHYNRGDVLSTELVLERGDIVSLDNGGTLTSLPNETEYQTGESDNYVDTENNDNLRDVVPEDETQTLLEEFKFGYGDFSPAVGDNIISLGHLWNGERQSAILISSYDPMDTELKAPAIAQYKGIRTFDSLSGYRTTCIAANGNNFVGKFLVNYNGNYIDVDERLNIFNADLNTGLEKVGIHLDGENSTIKLVGSVEIKQNSDGVPDTLTVWDDDNILRVKVSPEAIPNKSNIQTEINPTARKSFRSLTGQDYPTSGTIYEHHTWTEFIWTWNHKWQYYLSNAYFSYISTVDIGSFAVGDKITISNLSTTISSKAYFKGSTYVPTRSDSQNQQSISSIILRLKRWNGSTYTTVNSYNITNTATKTVANESATISLPSSILSNYQIPTAGSYRIELEVVHNVYASITFTEQQSNPYFMFDYSCRSSINLTQPSASMTRIGRNGLVFNTDSAGQYFYAGNDGIEMKWGDVGISLDSYGYRRYKKIYTVNNNGSNANNPYSYTIPIDADVIFINGSYVRLITSASANIPEGKELIIIGNSSTTYSSANLNPLSVSVSSTDSEGFTQTMSGSASSYRKHFIYHSSEWWEI